MWGEGKCGGGGGTSSTLASVLRILDHLWALNAITGVPGGGGGALTHTEEQPHETGQREVGRWKYKDQRVPGSP